MMHYTFQKYEKHPIRQGHLRMGGESPDGKRIDVNSAYLTRCGKPWIPVMGEFHFSRYDRKLWKQELCKMKAGGITLVSTYLFWIYHEELEGQFDFSGDNDVRAFVLECQSVGLEVALRIGPWAHGECRNGGFPDWLLKKPFRLRENNEPYLELVRTYFQKIAEQTEGLYYKDGGNIVLIQLENELGNNPEHLAALKRLAIEAGMEVPLYTVTGWGGATGAKIPQDEVLPMFGGYCEAPWERHQNKLPPSQHYFFERTRNDTAVGADLRKEQEGPGKETSYERYPFATCELGGGIQVTHHRRPRALPMDIYAVALVKLGEGNNLPGYYMYHGGTNKLGKLSSLQESKATGYPNDYPVLSYDFQAALSEYGEARGQYGLLNLLHLFLHDFEEDFAPMTCRDALKGTDRGDNASLRYGMRTDGERGFIFVNHYQRLTRLEDVRNVVFDTGNVIFPAMDICGDISFFMPFMMELTCGKTKRRGDRIVLEYATCQPVCRMENTYFFAEIPGIPARYKIIGLEKGVKGREYFVQPGMDSVLTVGAFSIVTLKWEQACFLRKLKTGREGTEEGVYLGNGCNLYAFEGEIRAVEDGEFRCCHWNGRRFEAFDVGKPAGGLRVSWQKVDTLPFALQHKDELQIGGERKLTCKRLQVWGTSGFVCIEDAYDVAQIYADGKLVADSYYYGDIWRVPAALLAGRECYLVMSELKDDFYREFE